MLPILVRGFDGKESVKVFKLAVKLIPRETSEMIGNTLIETGTKWRVKNKIVAFGADNCPTNFGNVQRSSTNNVHSRLKEALKRKIAGVGCVSHIIHNGYDTACDQLPILFESLVVVIYKHFHIHTLRVESLKEICEAQEIDYSALVNHSGTRFLTLHPAIQKVTVARKFY